MLRLCNWNGAGLTKAHRKIEQLPAKYDKTVGGDVERSTEFWAWAIGSAQVSRDFN